jgi:hypothetical protein
MKRSIATLFALLLAGCGLTSSPADNLTFQAPVGWQASPGILGYMQFWKPPSGASEMLFLFKSPKPIDTKQAFSDAKLGDENVEQQQQIKICGNQPAMFVKAKGTSTASGGSVQSEVQMTISTVGGNSYFAMYVYPANGRPNEQATAALRQLCAKP